MRRNILKTIFTLVPTIGMSMPLLSISSCSLQGDVKIDGDDVVKINQSKLYVVRIGEKICNNVTWNVSSSLEGQATISKNGLLTGKAPGNVTIIAQYEVNGSKHFAFKDITIKDFAMSPIPFNYFWCSGGYVYGFNDWVTREMLLPYDTFLVPSYVNDIGMFSFCRDFDGDGDNETCLPDNIVNLRFETGEDGISNIKSIQLNAFGCSPFRSIIFPVSRRGLDIDNLAFAGSKVEHCYFAPNITSIGGEAFADTKLEEVIFNNFYLDEGSVNKSLPPWMRKHQLIDLNSCVQHVGTNAFANCKNIKYHKISVYSKDVYELDYYGRGPFAPTDGTSEYSNINFVDLTSYRGSESESYLPNDLKAVLNLDIHDCYPPIWDPTPAMLLNRFLLYYDGLDGDAQSYLEEDIKDCLGNLPSPDPNSMIGDWNFAAQSRFNFAVDVGDNMELLYKPIRWCKQEGQSTPILRFRDCYSVESYDNEVTGYFPDDVVGTFDNVAWSDGVKTGRRLFIRQSPSDPNTLMLYCDADNKYDIVGKTVSFDLTLHSPSWHMTYTYKHHEALTRGEKAIDNHMIAQF